MIEPKKNQRNLFSELLREGSIFVTPHFEIKKIIPNVDNLNLTADI